VTPGRPRLAGADDRGHEVIGHTADARIRAWGPTLAALFEEAAAALADLTVAAVPGAAVTAWLDVDVSADDLERLAWAWLNELIGLCEVERAGILATEVVTLHGGGGGGGGSGSDGVAVAPWHLGGRAGLHPFDESEVHALRQVKAATLHGLRVWSRPQGWSLVAVLDV
jgi:SHS2 domain-containing protein